jgi:hypothetical protein
MNLICRLFGHSIEDRSYGNFWGGAIDGTLRIHDFYTWPCRRCGEKIHLYVHRQEEKNQFKQNYFMTYPVENKKC